MTKDGLNALNIQYNYLNLTSKVKGGGNEALYRWLADGTKAWVKSYRNTLLDTGGGGLKPGLDSLITTHPGITGPSESGGDGGGVSTFGLGDIVVPSWPGGGIVVDDKFMRLTGGLEYLGSLIYKRNADNELTLESTSFGGGRIEVADTGNGTSYTPNYFIADHLGSTRAVVKLTGNGREVVERNDYLPYGGRWEVPGVAISDNRFRFSGKEDQTIGKLPYQDFGARFFGGKLPIWTASDPHLEKYFSWSPYNYALNNPINYVDPDGRYVQALGPAIIYGGMAIMTIAAMKLTIDNIQSGNYYDVPTPSDVWEQTKRWARQINPGWGEQKKREDEAADALRQALLNVQNSIDENFPDPDPDGNIPPNPNRDFSVSQIVSAVVVVGAFLYAQFEDSDGDGVPDELPDEYKPKQANKPDEEQGQNSESQGDDYWKYDPSWMDND